MADLPRRQSSLRQQSNAASSSPRSPASTSTTSAGSHDSPSLAATGTEQQSEAGGEGNRASIGTALRVNVQIAPSAVRRSMAGELPSPVVGTPDTPPSQQNSPRTVANGSSTSRASFGGSTSSPRTGSSFPAPPVPSTSFRAPAEASETPKSSEGSLRRKPPPLEFSSEPVSPRSRPHGDSLASSEDDFEPPQSTGASPSKQSQLDEERDTLSGLISFDPSSSPVLTTSIPSARLSLTEDLSGENEDTVASSLSYLSSSTSSASTFGGSYSRPYFSSSYSSSSNPYNQGLGLGLPFSMSASANLSSLGTSPTAASPFASAAYSAPLPPPQAASSFQSTSPADPYRSPAGRSSTSPVADRGQLIGLGELATPRWTSGPLEKRWGLPESEERRQSTSTREKLEDRFDVVGTYGLEHEPMPAVRGSSVANDSPTIARPAPRQSAGRPLTTYDSPNRPFGGTGSSLYAPPLLPTSSSSATISTDAYPAALLNFGNDSTPQSFGPLDFTLPAPSSPVYSLDAVSVKEDSPQQRSSTEVSRANLRGSQNLPEETSQATRRTEVGKRRESRRKSFGAAASVPNSAAAGATWTTGGPGQDVIGLGFEHEINPPLPSSSSTEDAARKRTSAGSTTSASTKRSSTRSLSTDGKTSAKQHRRTSTGKGTFSHLPPSPAASVPSHAFAAIPSSPAPAVPPISTTAFPAANNASTSSAPPTTSSSVSTPSGRTPDHARLSRHSFASHHSSPSIVAASILRHTRDLEGVNVDISQAAASNEGTAAALAKLDGLSSPRMSRIASSSGAGAGGSAGGEPRSRKSSRGSGDVPPSGVRDSSQSVKRRARSSTGESGAAMAKDIERAFACESSGTSRSVSTNASPVPPTPALPSPPIALSAVSPSVPFTKSPLLPSVSQMSSATTSRAASRDRLAASTAAIPTEVPFPASSPDKRGSSSSASMTAGTWTSVSQDSTSATSLGTRSTASKYRRSSAGSDVSSAPSGNDGRVSLDRADTTNEADRIDIPPVPPLPKDWETYRPTTSTTSASSAQQSPRFDHGARRPSEASSFAESSGVPSPRAPPLQAFRTTSGSGKGTFESNLPVAATAPGSAGRRKWSISSAFYKATKSPKASPTAMKESTSYTDLQSAANRRERRISYGQHFGETALPRRLAASTSDIASLASGKSGHEGSSTSATGSLGRGSIHSGKVPTLARTRTSSQSSVSTTRTAQFAPGPSSIPTAAASAMPPPAVVATSPGRSRSSIINPRRTPSGIPFFRKTSSSDVSVTTPSPNVDKGDFWPSGEKSGRKSILGLNFLRSGGSKRDKEKGPLSPPSSSKRSTFSSATSSLAGSSSQSSSYNAPLTDEFGRRASLATPKSSSLLTRKRGKTFSSTDKGDVFGPPQQPVHLPPMQMNALPASTARRVDSMSSSGYSKPPVSSNTILQTPRTRSSKLQDSLKANLPTIAGSPSIYGAGTSEDARPPFSGPSPSTTPPPKAQTPTKIPRLKGTSVGGSSPRTSPVAPSTASKGVPRRMNSYGSALNENSAHLSASLSSANQPSGEDTADFGFVNREPGLAIGEKTLSTRRRVESESTAPSQIPRSRSTTSGVSSLSSSTRAAREPVVLGASSSTTALPRAGRRPSAVEEEKRTPSASSSRGPVRAAALSASTSRLPPQPSAEAGSSATVGLSASTRKPPSKVAEGSGIRRASVPATVVAEPPSTSKSSRSLVGKISMPTRVPKAASTVARLSPSTTESGRSSAASTHGLDDDKVKGDEEMAAYVRRQVTKNLAKGVSEETVRKMFEFPDPTDPLPPLSPDDAVSLYARYLSPYEKEEIRDYPKVYFVGPNCDKKPAVKENPTNNHGYDDDRGDYLLVMHDHIQYRYETIDVLGKGSFGQVLQCRDHKTGEMVAIKIIRNKKRFHHQALVEIKVLENLVKWDPEEKHYVIRMVESFTFRGHLCIVTELLSINLYELVKANSFAGFSTTLIRRFATQILKSLILLYHHRVVHCDLKPENILLRHPAKSGIKVIDFGSSCFENEKVYTYIQSRFYRSPEVILGMNYHMAIDMWSLGCILAEMFTGYPIFPGENEQEQLACIMEVQGLPDRYLIDKSSRKRLFFDSTGAPRPVVNSKGRRRRPGTKTLEQVLRCQDELFVDFIAKCLAWDPDRRLKPEKALRHPWIAGARALAPANIPSRTSRTSTALSASATRTATTSTHSSSPSISTPLKKLPSQASTSTAPVPRTRTVSYSSSIPSTGGGTRLGSKASLGLPPSSRYSVKS